MHRCMTTFLQAHNSCWLTKPIRTQADDEGLTPLHLSVQNNSIYTATLLINAGADLKAKNDQGQTPFDVAEELDADPCLLALLKGY